MKQRVGLLLVIFLAFGLASCSDQVVDDDLSGGAAEKKVKIFEHRQQKILNFVAHLKWDPSNTDADCQNAPGLGLARFQLRPNGEVNFRLLANNIENVTVAHIHLRAPSSPSGPPVVWLFPSTLPPTTPVTPLPGVFNGVLAKGSFTAANLVGPLAGQTLDDLIAAIRDGRTYVNVHTSRCPAGEIQGTIVSLNDRHWEGEDD